MKMNLEDTGLSEISQLQKDKYHMISHIDDILKSTNVKREYNDGYQRTVGRKRSRSGMSRCWSKK
jgi:phosphatidate phosphatase APP1